MRVESAPPVLRVAFDRPERQNTLDHEAVAGLRAQVGRVSADPDFRLLRLGAEGPTWCAGADLQAVAQAPEGLPGVVHGYADLLADLAECPVPVIAVVDGHVRGGGVGLLCAADLVVMGPRATATLPEGRVGLWPMMVGALLPRVMSPRAAMRVALTGERLGPEDCLRLGLATAVGPDPEVLGDEAAAVILRMAPGAVRAGRAAWRAHASGEAVPLRERLHRLADALLVLSGGPEAEEGIRAFFEKRPPVW